jgi:hypothetical protein
LFWVARIVILGNGVWRSGGVGWLWWYDNEAAMLFNELIEDVHV